MSAAGPLSGRRIVVTRERPGELGRLLSARGAEVIHVPLIAVVDAADGGTALRQAVDSLGAGDWLLVTSAAGADRVGAVADMPGVRLGAVGTATARRLAEVARRPVDVVPGRQLAAELAAAVDAADDAADEAADGVEPRRVVVAQADRAADTLVAALRESGFDVVAVTAYRTINRTPSRAELDTLARGVDALALASGSAAQGWVDAVGATSPLTPEVVVAIGPTTAEVAAGCGLAVTGVAAEHTLEGLVAELELQLSPS